MDPTTLVRNRVRAAVRFLQEFDKYVPVTAAFWLKDGETGQWELCVASDRLRGDNYDVAYGEVLRISAQLRDPGFDPFQVRLLEINDPLSRAALDVYTRHPARIPLCIPGPTFGGRAVEEVYLVKGPTGEFSMPSGRETLNHIIDEEAAFFETHGAPPRKMKLPVLMAYDLAKCGRDELGDLSGRVFKDGIKVFETEGFHGMNVEIIRQPNATLEFE